ncbi:MAG: holo-acyl-carrier protein synthase [Candidatus Saganbacteria bacterium]|uniref:Holo-[acyl-carrier-protein] synthase n=1 Tax=Candidatus Saganbacteria bacterium TaxID=2575572 RepID=A0A833L165_UNCSA|nr:MAG: holo-acyl-carrier protein synthase [Candidatus Saganbacteria bacterium]
MIKGIGIDIIEISRIKDSVEKFGNSFLGKIFTDNEIKYCATSTNSYKYPELAARFAAKEAYSKAIGTGLPGIKFKEIEISNNSQGKPHIAVSGKIQENIHISISHSIDFAAAFVVIE